MRDTRDPTLLYNAIVTYQKENHVSILEAADAVPDLGLDLRGDAVRPRAATPAFPRPVAPPGGANGRMRDDDPAI